MADHVFCEHCANHASPHAIRLTVDRYSEVRHYLCRATARCAQRRAAYDTKTTLEDWVKHLLTIWSRTSERSVRLSLIAKRMESEFGHPQDKFSGWLLDAFLASKLSAFETQLATPDRGERLFRLGERLAVVLVWRSK